MNAFYTEHVKNTEKLYTVVDKIYNSLHSNEDWGGHKNLNPTVGANGSFPIKPQAIVIRITASSEVTTKDHLSNTKRYYYST